jgi:hypothetical protein
MKYMIATSATRKAMVPNGLLPAPACARIRKLSATDSLVG